MNKNELIKEIKNLESPYPLKVFPEISRKDIEVIKLILMRHTKISIDRFSASLMRKAGENMREDIIKLIKGLE